MPTETGAAHLMRVGVPEERHQKAIARAVVQLDVGLAQLLCPRAESIEGPARGEVPEVLQLDELDVVERLSVQVPPAGPGLAPDRLVLALKVPLNPGAVPRDLGLGRPLGVQQGPAARQYDGHRLDAEASLREIVPRCEQHFVPALHEGEEPCCVRVAVAISASLLFLGRGVPVWNHGASNR